MDTESIPPDTFILIGCLKYEIILDNCVLFVLANLSLEKRPFPFLSCFVKHRDMERSEKKKEKNDNEEKEMEEEKEKEEEKEGGGDGVDEVEMDRLMALEYHQKVQVIPLSICFSLL